MPLLPGSRSGYRHIRCGTALPRTYWNRTPTSASFSGHAKLDTTALYTRVANTTIRTVTSPLDRLAALTATAIGLGVGLGLLGGALATAPYYSGYDNGYDYAPYAETPARTVWYWCDPYQGYYPAVPQCPVPWQQVVQ
jgi:hypothetical protein